MRTVKELTDKLSAPSDRLIADMRKLDGDLMILGVAGKMGPTLAALAARAFQACGSGQKVLGVARFSEPGVKEELETNGVETITADLLAEEDLKALPEAKNIIYMVGKKFGTSGNEPMTWALNTYLPGRVAEKFKRSRIIVFSSGNIYPYVPIYSGGATEETAPDPVGEYGQSCLGRERMFEYFSDRYAIPMLIYRLNYAVEMRYGTVLDVAQAVYTGEPIDLRNGHMNVIWQGDANEIALRALLHCSTPPKLLNVTGPETISVRWLAQTFGRIFQKEPRFINEEEPTWLLNNASLAHQLFGYPSVPLQQIVEWTADWVEQGGTVSNKPTHFQVRSGKF
jgi:nucleoside-diphosphate-sugar epimerase